MLERIYPNDIRHCMWWEIKAADTLNVQSRARGSVSFSTLKLSLYVPCAAELSRGLDRQPMAHIEGFSMLLCLDSTLE